MAQRGRSGDEGPQRWGYVAAVAGSAAAHIAIFVLVLVVLPAYLKSHAAPPPAYTVKIVGSLPAGDLGTHLPKLAQAHQAPPREPSKSKPPAPKPPETGTVIALNNIRVTPTPTPTPTPEPTPAPTPLSKRATPRPTPRHHHRRRATPTPTPHHTERYRPHPRTIVIAEPEHHRHPTARPTPNVKEELARVRAQLLAEHLKAERSASAAGPVVASTASAGKGYGVGPGEGSAGIQQQVDFLLYYQVVQKKIRAAWTFSGGSNDLTAAVIFRINPDGTVGDVKIKQGSGDGAFDESVIRAIKRAAPFPTPPKKYQAEFSQGIEATFTLGELKKS